MRIDKDNYYLNIAKAVAARSTCLRRQYGAVIVADDEIIATGYNGAPRGEANCCDVGKCYCREHSTPIDEHAARHGDQYGTCVAVHAEQNAIIQAARMGVSIAGATLYCTHQPCVICAKMIINSGIKRIVYEQVLKNSPVTTRVMPIEEAKKNGRAVKLLAGLDASSSRLRAYVEPKEIPMSHPLASINGATNAITVTTDNLGDVTLIGPGAGRKETGQALLGDMIRMSR